MAGVASTRHTQQYVPPGATDSTATALDKKGSPCNNTRMLLPSKSRGVKWLRRTENRHRSKCTDGTV